MINIIVATSTNLVIGKDNDLPWHLPTDMKYFKDTTKGHIVVMGRKCWESIPEKYRPLPNRTNIVMSRDKNYVAEGASVSDDLEKLLKMHEHSDKEVFIIGGANLYKEAFQYAHRLYLTQIYSEVEGDVYLEGLESKDWCLIEGSEMHEENGFKFRFELYKKNDKKDCI
jgi:dihydrofolate reductase